MEYRKLEGIKAPLSRLVYGTGSAKVTSQEDESVLECLDAAWETGFRTFDTAHTYGLAEKNLGRWLARHGKREEMVLNGKGCNPGQKGVEGEVFSAEAVKKQLLESLDTIGTDYLDFYILHRDDETKPVDEMIELLNECKDNGMISRFGASNWTMARIKEANEYAKAHGLEGFTAVSPCFSLAEFVNDPWGGSVTISRPENAPYREWLAENQLPVFNYSALGRGFLSGKYKTDGGRPMEDCLWWAPIEEYNSPDNIERLRRAEQLAKEQDVTVSKICLAWVLAQPMNMFPIVSPTSPSHMKDNVEALQITLTEAQQKWLNLED